MTKPKYQKVIAIALILGGAVAGISGYVHFRQAAVHSETGNTDSSHSPDHLVFPPNAPQLTYIKTSRAVISPLPASEPLTARLALAENHTARVIPAVAGRILQLHAEIGDQVSTGTPSQHSTRRILVPPLPICTKQKQMCYESTLPTSGHKNCWRVTPSPGATLKVPGQNGRLRRQKQSVPDYESAICLQTVKFKMNNSYYVHLLQAS